MATEKGPKLQKIAAGMAFLIGAMAVFAGGRVVLFGILPDYHVIDWLPVYNFSVGIVTVLFSAVTIWKNHKLAAPSAFGIFGLHAIVMVVLLTAYSTVVAPDSLVAMGVRLVFWAIILALLVIQRKRNNSKTK